MKKTLILTAFLAAIAAIGAGIYHIRKEMPYEAFEKKDYARARELLTPRAAKGDGKAQWTLGMVEYFEAKDYAKAKQWFEQAVENGESNALLYLAEMYQYPDRGVTQDFVRARALLEQGVEKGNAVAADRLFQMDSQPFEVDYLAFVKEHKGLAEVQEKRRNAPQWLEKRILLDKQSGATLLLWHVVCNGYREKDLPALLPVYESLARGKGGDGYERKQRDFAYFRLGMLALEAHDIDKAAAYLTAVSDHASDKIHPYAMARLHEARGEYAKARDDYRKSDSCIMPAADAHYRLARLQAQGTGGDKDIEGAWQNLAKLEEYHRGMAAYLGETSDAAQTIAAQIADLREKIAQAENHKLTKKHAFFTGIRAFYGKKL